MMQSGFRDIGSALARSWVSWGQPLEQTKYGCAAVLTADDAVDWKGHVGLFLRNDEDCDYLFGGNQLEDVRELAYPRDRLLAYRYYWCLVGSAVCAKAWHLRSLVRSATLRPQCHVYVDAKAPWHAITYTLLQYEEGLDSQPSRR
jgi:hypothetical protein